MSRSIRKPDGLTLALVAETLRVDRCFHELPTGDDDDDDAADDRAAQLDARLKAQHGLIDTFLKDRSPSEAVEDLAVFAAAAVEQWAELSGQDPFDLLRDFGL